MNSSITHRSACPLASALDVFGDKWTLLVVRDLLSHGHRTYQELQQSWEKMPTNILAERLKKLEAIGIISKQPYQQRPVRNHYSLTKKGMALTPAIKAIALWGQEYIESTKTVLVVKDGVATLNQEATTHIKTL